MHVLILSFIGVVVYIRADELWDVVLYLKCISDLLELLFFSSLSMTRVWTLQFSHGTKRRSIVRHYFHKWMGITLRHFTSWRWLRIKWTGCNSLSLRFLNAATASYIGDNGRSMCCKRESPVLSMYLNIKTFLVGWYSWRHLSYFEFVEINSRLASMKRQYILDATCKQ